MASGPIQQSSNAASSEGVAAARGGPFGPCFQRDFFFLELFAARLVCGT